MQIPQINPDQLRERCKGKGLSKVAQHLGIIESTLFRKLKNPTEKFSCAEYFKICALLEEPIETFIEGELKC